MVDVGWEKWPAVYQYVQFFTLSFVILSNFINRKQFYGLHVIIIMAFIASLSIYYLNPKLSLGITAVAVTVIAIDLIGEITSTNALMKIFNSLQYKKLSPKLILYNTVANICATILVILVQKFGGHKSFTFIIGTASLIHLYLYLTVSRRANESSGMKSIYIESPLEKIQDTINYALKNRLVIMGVSLIIWSQVAKFFCDWIYLTSASSVFTSADKLSTFIGVVNLGVMIGVVFVQQAISSRVTKRFSPATLLSFVPISFLILSFLGSISNSPYIGICVNILFLILFRSIHMPTLKVCLQSIDSKIKPKVFLLMNFCISLLLLFVTTSIQVVKSYFTIELIYASLILMAIIAILIIIRFDGHYLRNLWENVFETKAYKDLNDRVQFSTQSETNEKLVYFNPHHYFVAPYEKTISTSTKEFIEVLKLFPKENMEKDFINIFYDSQTKPFEKLILIINCYIYSKNLRLFQEATVAHKYLFKSKDQEEKEKAYQLFNLIGIPIFSNFLKDGCDSDLENVSSYSNRATSLSDYIEELNPGNTIFHKRLKLFILLNWEYLTPANQQKLKDLMSVGQSEVLVELVSWLGSNRINTTKQDLLKSFDTYKMRFDFVDYIERYLNHSHTKRKEMQEILLSVKCPGKNKIELERKIEDYLIEAKEKIDLDEILDLLFLVEWIHIKEDEYRYALSSVQDYKNLQDEEGEYWKDFHMEFLKKMGLHQFYDLIEKRL